MIGQFLFFVCAVLTLSAGTCIETPCSQRSVSSPVVTDSIYSAPAYSTESFSVPLSSAIISSPAVNQNVLSSGCANAFSSVSSPAVSLGSSLASSQLVSDGSYFSDNSLSEGLSSGFVSGLTSGFGIQVTDGPSSTPITVVQAPAVTLPTVKAPVVTLSSQPIPAPRVLSQRCICTKTVVKPKIVQRQITVPKIQRYIKRTVTPVVENVSFKASPVGQGYSSNGVFPGFRPGITGLVSSGLESGVSSYGIRSPVSLPSGYGLSQDSSCSPVSVSSQSLVS